MVSLGDRVNLKISRDRFHGNPREDSSGSGYLMILLSRGRSPRIEVHESSTSVEHQGLNGITWNV